MASTITITLTTIVTDEGTIDYFPWWSEPKNNARIVRTMLENEESIEEQLRDWPIADRFFLKFLINNTPFRAKKDPFIQAGFLLFFVENLPRALDRAAGQKSVRLEPPFDKNLSLHRLIATIVSTRTDTTFATPEPGRRAFTYRRAIPFAMRCLNLSETLLGTFARWTKSRRTGEEDLILSNVRHHDPDDKKNLFWGSLLPLLAQGGIERPSIIYYQQLMPFQPGYFGKLLTDRRHRYLSEQLTLKGYFVERRACRGLRIPVAFCYKYGGVDYGETLLPLVDAYCRIFRPLLLKYRQALQGLLAGGPKRLYIDSEISLIGMTLGFLERDARLIAMSNEVVFSLYAALPTSKGFARPTFDLKVVYGSEERRILEQGFGYPREKLVLFPDPRFLAEKYDGSERRDCIVIIGGALPKQFTQRFVEAARGVRTLPPLLFKRHPSIPKEIEPGDAQVETLTERQLGFVPRYAVASVSTLGLELLFHGTIVFFIDAPPYSIKNYYGIAKEVPFLICKSEQEMAQKIQGLEQDGRRRERTLGEIRAFLARRYAPYDAAARERLIAAIKGEGTRGSRTATGARPRSGSATGSGRQKKLKGKRHP